MVQESNTDDSEIIGFSKSVKIDSSFTRLMEEIRHADIHLPSRPVIVSGMTDFYNDNSNYLVIPIETDKSSITLNAHEGCILAHDPQTLISAYDESIAYFSSLEGKVAYVSHSLVSIYKDQYYPLNQLNLIFCTKSKLVHERIPGSILAKDWDTDVTISVAIAEQKREFIVTNAIPKSILFIDGPFLAGSGSFTFYEAIDDLLSKSVLPIFIVKNSQSTMLVDNIAELRGAYNSDLHYANEVLKEGSRSPYFKYTSELGNKSKIFCYLKHKTNYSPIRVEIPSVAFDRFRESVDNAMDMIYYLILTQGSSINPQVRPIAVAEKFARETLGLININKDTIEMKLTATMNEQRGME